jgi:hypothetical protein
MQMPADVRRAVPSRTKSYHGNAAHKGISPWTGGSARLKAPNMADEKFEDVVKSAQQAAVLVY